MTKPEGHTALPWNYFVGNANGRGLIRIEVDGSHPTEAGEHIASMPRGKKSERRAALIVRAVNCHEDLVKALETCLTAEHERRKKLKPGAPATTYTEARIAMLHDVLARAKEQTP